MKGTGNSGKGRFWLTLALVMTLIVIAVTISTTIGAVNVSASDIGKILVNKMSGKDIFQIAWEGKTENIIWNIRFPRVLMAFIVGAGLSLCGVLMQALTKNPLADPYVLGISSGASAGAVGVIILGWFSFLGGYSVIFGATLGAAISICLSLGIASMKGRITSTQLVLAGIATSAFFSAVTNLIIYGFNQGSDKTKMAQYWMVAAAAPEQAPDAAALKRALSDSDRAQKTAAERSAQAAGLRGQLDAVRGALAQSCRALTPPLDPDTLAETLPALRAAAARDAEALAAQHTAQQQALSALQALEAGLPAQEEALRRQQADIQERAQELSARAARCAELDAETERRAQELPHENRAAAQRALVETRTQCEALQQALDTARERSSAAQSVLAALTGKRDALRAQIQAAPPADIAALRTRRDALTVRAEQLQKQISTCDARLEQNRAARTAIDTRRQQHAAVRARWQWVHALAATANGAVPGKEKIMLETYIQTAYFDRILGRANTRLLIMSGGQYELRRCARAGDNRSQTGLELEVIDHYNGTARSVKTLSGGETFAASLSLALGLSDEVQATAGGVQLEAMFVDEGFGSLDSEALQQALAALVGVSGGSRIVGIISHVAELKDRIDRQIIVTKDRSGGSRVQVQA